MILHGDDSIVLVLKVQTKYNVDDFITDSSTKSEIKEITNFVNDWRNKIYLSNIYIHLFNLEDYKNNMERELKIKDIKEQYKIKIQDHIIDTTETFDTEILNKGKHENNVNTIYTFPQETIDIFKLYTIEENKSDMKPYFISMSEFKDMKIKLKVDSIGCFQSIRKRFNRDECGSYCEKLISFS